MDIDTLHQLMQTVTSAIRGQTLDEDLGNTLNTLFPANGEVYAQILALCQKGTREQWICQKEHGGIRYGRVFAPDDSLDGFSVDIVLMKDIVGPRHTHPKGEIDLILPLINGACFDDHPAGWLVYGPHTTHRPTVTNGEAFILYLLPEGSIEFH
uniref:4-hydroxylaminobenzoate lyase n=1 Tax=Castellaniella defragrans TaxID=75697 RepID=UPI0033409C14